MVFGILGLGILCKITLVQIELLCSMEYGSYDAEEIWNQKDRNHVPTASCVWGWAGWAVF